METWNNFNFFQQIDYSNHNIYYSAIYLCYCLIALNGIGKFINKKFLQEIDIHPFLGIIFLFFLGGFVSLNLINYNIIIYAILPIGFFYYCYLVIIKENIIYFEKKFFLYYFFLIIFFLVGFFQFHFNYDDHVGYFPLIEFYKSKNIFKNTFSWRSIETYPAFYFFNSIFLYKVSYFQSKFIDIFYCYYLTSFLILKYIKKNNFCFSQINIIFFLIFFLVFSINTTVSSQMFVVPFILLAIISVYEISSSKKNFNYIFIFYLTCAFLPLISFKNIPISFFIVFFGTFLILSNKVIFSKVYFSIFLASVLYVPWFLFSYYNFETILYPLLGKGTSFESYYQFSYYIDQIKNVSIFDKFILSLNNILTTGYANITVDKIIFLKILFSKYNFFQFFISIFLIVYITFFTKIKYLFYLPLILFLTYLSFFFTDAGTWVFYKFLYPYTIAFIIFSMLLYFSFIIKNKSKISSIIIVLFFFSFEKISLLSNLRNATQELIGINTRGGLANNFNILYSKNYTMQLRELTQNLNGKNILTYIDYPYLLNMKKNNIYPIDFHSFFTSPAPGYPIHKSFQDQLNFFRNNNIDFILFDESLLRPNWRSKSINNNEIDILEPKVWVMNDMNKDFFIFLNKFIQQFPNLLIKSNNFYLIHIF